jgi:hypothetical protein
MGVMKNIPQRYTLDVYYTVNRYGEKYEKYMNIKPRTKYTRKSTQ